MVNERSPAKVPLSTVVPNDQPPKPAEGSLYAPKPVSNVPQFGQTSLPQSPLHKALPKEKSVFIQPKARPEHHREVEKHPHLQALKDATHRVVDPLVARAAAAYLPENRMFA